MPPLQEHKLQMKDGVVLLRVTSPYHPQTSMCLEDAMPEWDGYPVTGETCSGLFYPEALPAPLWATPPQCA